MKLKSITIEKFRSIKKSTIYLNKINAIVGENNAGKTAILRAINSILNFKLEDPFFLNKTHQYALRNNTYINIILADVDSCKYKDYSFNRELHIFFSYDYSKFKSKMYIKCGTTTINIDDRFMDELRNDILYVYITSERTSSDISWENDSIIKDLILEHFSRQTQNRDSISNDIKRVANKIHDKIVTKLEKEINQVFMSNVYGNLKIKFPDNMDYNTLISNLNLYLNVNQSDLSVNEWGSGTKSLAIIAMYRTKASMYNGSIVLGLEEPETNLHPQAQRRFIDSLKKDLFDSETQAIFTTHSTVLIDELNHDDIILVRRINDTSKNSREFHSYIKQIVPEFWNKNSLEKFKHEQFFSYKNSDFFFSKYVIIGESKNDCQVLDILLSPKIKDLSFDVSYIDAGGVENIKYPYYLLKELDLPFSVVFDHDFLFNYKNNNELKSSRDSNWLPMYSNKITNQFIKDILSENDVITIEKNSDKYIEIVKVLSKYKLYMMRYCLEMDLTCSEKALKEFFDIMNIPASSRTQKDLLVSYKNAIKKIETIINVVRSIPPKAYPKSYLYITKGISDNILENIK